MFIKNTVALSTLAVVCGLIACSEQPTAVDAPNLNAAQAAYTFTTHDWIDRTGVTRFNACTDEPMVLAGRIHVQFHVTETGNGVQISGSANLDLPIQLSDSFLVDAGIITRERRDVYHTNRDNLIT